MFLNGRNLCRMKRVTGVLILLAGLALSMGSYASVHPPQTEKAQLVDQPFAGGFDLGVMNNDALYQVTGVETINAIEPLFPVTGLAGTEVVAPVFGDSKANSLSLPINKTGNKSPLLLSLMIPTVGRIVRYRLTEDQQKLLGGNHDPTGGNLKEAPGIIVNVHGPDATSLVNLKVSADSGVPDLWVTSVGQGDQPGQWYEPPRS